MQLDFVIAPLAAGSPCGELPFGQRYTRRCISRCFFCSSPSLALLVFPFPLSALFPFHPLQCIPIPFFCDWPSPMLTMLMRAPAESKWGLCSLCSSPSHTCTPKSNSRSTPTPRCCWGITQAPHKNLVEASQHLLISTELGPYTSYSKSKGTQGVQRNLLECKKMQRSARNCKEMQRHAKHSELQRAAKEGAEAQEMQRAVLKCKEIQRSARNCKEMQRM